MFDLPPRDRGDESSDPFSGIADGVLQRLFAGWEIVEDEVVAGVADWDKESQPLVRFLARKA